MKNQYRVSKFSSVDDVGRVFISENKVLRAINSRSLVAVNELLKIGLIDELVSRGLFVKSTISAVEIAGYPLVIEHEKIEPEIYPFEWSPEMLRRAALCILAVNECANKYGYELKDAHPYNVMFKGSRAVFIDFGSLAKQESATVWLAYDEFLGSCFYPLKLCEKGLIRLYKHMYLLGGVAVGRVELGTVLNPASLIIGQRVVGKVHKIIHSYRNGASISIEKINTRIKNPVANLLARIFFHSRLLPFRPVNIRSLAKKIENINFGGRSMWGDYHTKAGFYSDGGQVKLSPRMSWVVDVVNELKPESIIELAGNQGILSRVLSDMPGVKRVICTDYDEKAIDQLLINAKDEDKVGIACFDFMGEVWQALSHERSARLRSEMVIALAVTHHLILTQKYSIDSILKALTRYSSKYLIVEFMPLGLWDGATAPAIPEWYNETWFIENLSRYCDILQRKELEPNRVSFVVKIKKSAI
jgi:hypothetical protein